MSYIIKPSLERSALLKTVISLWNEHKIRNLIDKLHVSLCDSKRQENELFFPFPDHNNLKQEWQKIEDEVTRNVAPLLLPKSLKNKLLHFIKPVGLQILQWMEYHINCHLGVILPNNLCWKQQGTVDRKRTAEILVKDDTLDVSIRYQLACINCLKDDILELWEKMPENRTTESIRSHESSDRQQEFTVLWKYDTKGQVSWMHSTIEGTSHHPQSPYQFAFEWVALGGNKVAAEYFFEKLTDAEKEESLVKTAGNVVKERCQFSLWNDGITQFRKDGYAEVLCFLLSQMDEEKQLQVFRNCPYQVLKCLLDWPWQDFFMEAANRMWGFLPDHCYFGLLEMIVGKQFQSYYDGYYQELFRDFWQESLPAHKKYVIRQCETAGHLLSTLFRVEDKESIRLILKETNLKEKERIVFNGKGMLICERLIYHGKWDLLKFFVHECILPTNLKIRFCKELKEHVIRNYRERPINNKPNMWNDLCRFLDEHVYNGDQKRSNEEGDTNSSKKFRRAE